MASRRKWAQIDLGGPLGKWKRPLFCKADSKVMDSATLIQDSEKACLHEARMRADLWLINQIR